MVLQTLVITIPRNQQRADETKAHLEKNGFPHVQLMYGYTAKPNTCILTAASKSHYKAAKYASQFTTPVIIAEDDCRVSVGNAMPQIEEAIKYLTLHRPRWQLLAIGHCGLGPIWPLLDYPQLCHSTLPFSGICYILNPSILDTLVHSTPIQQWRRPQMVEGWLGLKMTQKYAFTYSLTTMGSVPKEIANIPVLAKMDLTAGAYTMSQLNLFIYPLILYFLVYFLCFRTNFVFP